VLRDGGRLAIPDVVATAESSRISTISIQGAFQGVLYRQIGGQLAQSGFSRIKIEPKDESRTFIKD